VNRCVGTQLVDLGTKIISYVKLSCVRRDLLYEEESVEILDLDVRKLRTCETHIPC